MEEVAKSEIIIYKDQAGPELQVRFEGDTVWMNQGQIAALFGTQRPAITKHLNNIYKSLELSEKSVRSILEHTAADGKKYQVKYYNLDAIISIGYRVNSKRATQFRIWATHRLRDYLVKGYAVNEHRLKEDHDVKMKEMEKTAGLFLHVLENRRAEGYEKDLLKIITDYAHTWAVLNKYDKGELEVLEVSKYSPELLKYEELQKSIEIFKKRLAAKKEANSSFGEEVANKFETLLSNIGLTFGSKQQYSSLEEKAAHLLYLVIKERPFADGNKRIGSLVFMLYLVQNNFLYSKKSGERKINDNALAALALLVAESKPHDKEAMINLIVNLINRK